MKKYLLSFAVMMMGAALFTACDDNDNEPTYVPVPVSNGVYVVCGGNTSAKVGSSLSYIDYATKTSFQGQFKANNGRELGGTANDGLVYGGKLYIVVTGDNTIEVVDAKTLKSIKQISTTELMGKEKGASPRHITADGGLIYVSTYGSSTADWSTYTSDGNGYVAAIDTISFALKETYTAGSFPEGLAVANGHLYVANSDYSIGSKPSISNIDLATGKDTPITDSQITNPTTVATDGNNLYVLDMGNYYDVAAGLRRISGTNVTTLFDATVVGFAGYNIYGINAPWGADTPTTFTVYNIQSNTKQEISTGLDNKFFSPNVINTDPITGKIYIASYNENPSKSGSAGYAVNAYVAEYAANGTFEKTYDIGVGPNAIIFNTAVNYVQQ